MSNDSTYPAELFINTKRVNNTWWWDIRDEHGNIYDCTEAKDIWFAAMKDDVDIDHNLTFARLVERGFRADQFNRYLNER